MCLYLCVHKCMCVCMQTDWESNTYIHIYYFFSILPLSCLLFCKQNVCICVCVGCSVCKIEGLEYGWAPWCGECCVKFKCFMVSWCSVRCEKLKYVWVPWWCVWYVKLTCGRTPWCSVWVTLSGRPYRVGYTCHTQGTRGNSPLLLRHATLHRKLMQSLSLSTATATPNTQQKKAVIFHLKASLRNKVCTVLIPS